MQRTRCSVRPIFWAAAVSLVMFVGPAYSAQPTSDRFDGVRRDIEPPGSVDSESLSTQGSWPPTLLPEKIDDLMQEFEFTSREVQGRPGGDEALHFDGQKVGDWFDALVVSNHANPLLSEGCKKRALQLSVDRLRVATASDSESSAIRAAAAHVRSHLDFVKSHGISYAGYLHELSTCRTFCGPLVASLIECQIVSVAGSQHAIVLFSLDHYDVDPRYVDGSIARVADFTSLDSDRRIAVIGRASKSGDLLYNRRLAARRAMAVRDSLVDDGVEKAKIRTMWFGWEPPQISRSIADQYGFGELFARAGQGRMNQSVMLVVYTEKAESGEDVIVPDPIVAEIGAPVRSKFLSTTNPSSSASVLPATVPATVPVAVSTEWRDVEEGGGPPAVSAGPPPDLAPPASDASSSQDMSPGPSIVSDEAAGKIVPEAQSQTATQVEPPSEAPLDAVSSAGEETAPVGP